MATLTRPTLNIDVDVDAARATVVVTGLVRFTELERTLMQHGLEFRLTCTVHGDDSPGRPLNIPLEPREKVFTGQQPANVSYRFSALRFPRSELNEDLLGGDEIVGTVVLTNNLPPVPVTRSSNIVASSFAKAAAVAPGQATAAANGA